MPTNRKALGVPTEPFFCDIEDRGTNKVMVSDTGEWLTDADVTELELIELIKKSIREKVFSEGFIEMLKQEINKI